jgi:hypothetical protein
MTNLLSLKPYPKRAMPREVEVVIITTITMATSDVRHTKRHNEKPPQRRCGSKQSRPRARLTTRERQRLRRKRLPDSKHRRTRRRLKRKQKQKQSQSGRD